MVDFQSQSASFDEYTTFLKSVINIDISQVYVVFGTQGKKTSTILEKLFDSLFLQYTPVTIEDENAPLKKVGIRVVESGADLGCVIDAVENVISFVDEEGRPVEHKTIMCVLAREYLSKNKGCSFALHPTCDASLSECVSSFGGTVIPCKDAEEFSSLEAVFFADGQGRLVFKEMKFPEQVVLVLLRVMESIARSEKLFSEMFN